SEIQGVSLAQHLRGASSKESRKAVSENLDPETYHLRSIRGNRFKYIELKPGGSVLYDLKGDPGEHSDVSSERIEVSEELRAELDRFVGGSLLGWHIRAGWMGSAHRFSISVSAISGFRNTVASDNTSLEVLDNGTMLVWQGSAGPNASVSLRFDTEAETILLSLRKDDETIPPTEVFVGSLVRSPKHEELSGLISVGGFLDAHDASIPVGAHQEFENASVSGVLIWKSLGSAELNPLDAEPEIAENLRSLGYVGQVRQATRK
ncbi:MAG TPA: hypothetical protein PKH07_07640, partial [bacterium]|nr:hypothetical protein [bacterium]